MEPQVVVLLLKLAVAAAMASIIVRLAAFQRLLLEEQRTAGQRVLLALIIGVPYSAGVAVRVITQGYRAADMGVEGSLLAGLVGGYSSGLIGGAVIALPATLNGEFISLPLFVGLGLMGGLVRDLAPDPEEVWRFSPFFDLYLYRIFRRWKDQQRVLFHLVFFLSILFAEFLRISLFQLFGHRKLIFSLAPLDEKMHAGYLAAMLAATLFATVIPLKIWNNSRNERKLEIQSRLLTEARLRALSRQINPHFLFNTLNTVSSLIRTDPEKARSVVFKLAKILRRLLRSTEDLSTLREELAFIEDYLSIEMVRFGDKLRFSSDVDPCTLDLQVPSMLLQPLVENSIRHGLSKKVGGGRIRIESRLNNGRLRLAVEDDGVGIPEARMSTLYDSGIGISNVRERLQVLYGNRFRMRVESKVGEGTRTTIEIEGVRPEPSGV